MARAFHESFGKTHENISRDDFENNFYLEAAFGKVICLKSGRDYRYFPFLIYSPAQILKFFVYTSHRLFFSLKKHPN